MLKSRPAYLSAESLEFQIARLRDWSQYTQVPDPVHYLDYLETAHDLARIWIRDGDPGPLTLFPYPKASGAMRALSIVAPRDNARLRAAVGAVLDVSAKRLGEDTFCTKLVLPPPRWKLRQHLYFKFVHRARHNVRKWECEEMIRTDVQAYFPSISIETMLRTLWDADCDRECCRFVVQHILDWQDAVPQLSGLPIGPEPFAILGSFFLEPVDRAMRARATWFLRYMDDMTYGCDHDLAQSNHGYELLDEALADLGLVRSTSKSHPANNPTDALELISRSDLDYIEAYLRRMPGVRTDLATTASHRSFDKNTSPASRLHYLRVVAASHSSRQCGYDALSLAQRETLSGPERTWAVWAYGNSRAYNVTDLADALKREHDPTVRRAGILTLRRADPRFKRDVGRLLAKGDEELHLSADWARAA